MKQTLKLTLAALALASSTSLQSVDEETRLATYMNKILDRAEREHNDCIRRSIIEYIIQDSIPLAWHIAEHEEALRLREEAEAAKMSIKAYAQLLASKRQDLLFHKKHADDMGMLWDEYVKRIYDREPKASTDNPFEQWRDFIALMYYGHVAAGTTYASHK